MPLCFLQIIFLLQHQHTSYHYISCGRSMTDQCNVSKMKDQGLIRCCWRKQLFLKKEYLPKRKPSFTAFTITNNCLSAMVNKYQQYLKPIKQDCEASEVLSLKKGSNKQQKKRILIGPIQFLWSYTCINASWQEKIENTVGILFLEWIVVSPYMVYTQLP